MRNSDRIKFVCDSIEHFSNSHGPIFDLVIIVDVIHHVAPDKRKALLLEVKKLLKSNGVLIVKDWAATKTPVNFFAYFMDRYVSNGPTYFSADAELRQLFAEVFGSDSIKGEMRIRHCHNNIILFVKS